MVLAAGVGTRLEPLTTQVPKPMVPIANVPVMEHILHLLKANGFDEICANIHYLPDQISDYFQDGEKFGVKLHLLKEEQLTGDAGGVRACRQYLDQSTFIVLMGDLLTDANLESVVRRHKEKKAIATIALKEVSDVSHFGVAVLDQNGFIKGFQEKPQPEEALSNLASTGIYVLEPEVFDHVPKTGSFGFGRQLFPSLVAKGLPVLGHPIEAYWNDVGTIEQYRLTNFDALNGELKVDLPGKLVKHAGGTMRVGNAAKVSEQIVVKGTVLIGANSVVGNDVVFNGNVVIGDNCVIGEGVQFTDSIVWEGSQIGDRAVIKDSVLGKSSRIAPGVTQEGTATVPTSGEQLAFT
jgi:mannose-1-phosphate guanylyltransferase/mannose-1-phosphate guanylyltransferase/phosphomannomutase